MACLARQLAEDGYRVKCWSLADMPDTGRPGEATEAKRIVLGTPMLRDGRINGTGLEPGELWKRLRRGTEVYAGAVGERERREAEALGLSITDYLAGEALAVKNAAVTAEGAVVAAAEKLGTSLRGTRCLVVGFGRIGKLLARDLAALGARVSVSARSDGDIAWIETLGYEPLSTLKLAGELREFSAVFNTVPAMVLDEELLRELPRPCAVIELASKDGIDAEAAEKLGLDYLKLPGIPGRYAPESAARAIKETLYRLWG